MRCPFCAFEETQVKDSRPSDDNTTIRRRRFCSACGAKFTTFERVHLRDLVIIKKNGETTPFIREKLVKSIDIATRKRSVTSEQIEQMVNGIVRQLESLGESDVTTRHIGERVMQALLHLDPVSYIRYASVYKDFNNLNDFEEIVKSFKISNTVSE